MECPWQIVSAPDWTPAEKLVACVIYSCASLPRERKFDQGGEYRDDEYDEGPAKRSRRPRVCFLDVDKVALAACVSTTVVASATRKGIERGWWKRRKTSANRGEWLVELLPAPGFQWAEAGLDEAVAEKRADRTRKRLARRESGGDVPDYAPDGIVVVLDHA